MAPEELTPEGMEQFLVDRRAKGYKTWVSPRSLNLPMTYLRAIEVVPEAPAVPEDDVVTMVAAYRHYLLVERGLTVKTIATYGSDAGRFLSVVASGRGLRLERLDNGDVLAFVKHECSRRPVPSAQHLLVSLRSLLRYLHVSGAITAPLAAAVPAIARRRQFLPRGIGAADVGASTRQL